MVLSTILQYFPDVIGLIGVMFILVAYFLISMNRVSPNSIYYHSANFIGAIAILFSLLYNFNFSSVVIEIAWMAISIVGMIRIRKMAR